MLYLWIFGNNIEDALGHVKFLLFYLMCGVLAAGAHVIRQFARACGHCVSHSGRERRDSGGAGSVYRAVPEVTGQHADDAWLVVGDG